jgi:hypothetical protein
MVLAARCLQQLPAWAVFWRRAGMPAVGMGQEHQPFLFREVVVVST